MRRRDEELIADLLAGRSEDPIEAMETIVRSPRLQAAYEEQLAAMEALAGLDPVSMSESERSDLRRDVWTRVTAATPVATPAGSWGWRVAGAAAALAVVVGGAALFMQGSSAQDDLVSEAAGFEADSVTTTAAAGGPLFGRGDSEEGGEAAPQRVETEDLLRRQAEIIRSNGTLNYSLAGGDVRCAELDELEGLRPVAEFDIEGVVYQAWVPEEAVANEIDENTPLTFVDTKTCTVLPTTR